MSTTTGKHPQNKGETIMTLNDFYFKTVADKPDLVNVKWKIVDKTTHKILCGDFVTCGYLTTLAIENKSVWSSAINTTKNNTSYVRVTVYDPIKLS
jgi:hypothetical protein